MTFFVSLVLLVLIIAVLGCCVWLITTKIPMDDTFKVTINIVVVVFVVLYILGVLIGKFPLPTFPSSIGK